MLALKIPTKDAIDNARTYEEIYELYGLSKEEYNHYWLAFIENEGFDERNILHHSLRSWLTSENNRR